jgi:CheY-like chemotaxis protein
MLLSTLPEATVLEAYNGQQALDILEQKQVDLILMDVQMPGMDGLEATRLIRLKEAQAGIASSVPIVALTAGVIKEEKEKCLKAGMNEFLAKPLSDQALKDILFSYLKSNTQTNQAQMKKPDREALQHFNMKELQERTELSRDILLPMADISMSTLNNYLQSLAKVIQEENETEVKSLAHTIKGLALNMSFGHMTNLAKSMENQSEQGQQKVKELFEEMKKEWEIIRELVKNA